MKQVLILLANGFEEAEAVITIDILRRAPIKVDLVAVGNDVYVISSNDVIIKADACLSDINFDQYDGLIVPGGSGVSELRSTPLVKTIIQKFNQAKKYIGAICAGPLVLQEAGILKGCNFTCHPSIIEFMDAKKYLPEAAAVIYSHVVTSQSVGTSIAFALAFASFFISSARYEELKHNLIIKNPDTIVRL